MAKQRKGGKRNRKHGRWGRSPSMNRYLAEQRWISNKAKKVARHEREVARKAGR